MIRACSTTDIIFLGISMSSDVYGTIIIEIKQDVVKAVYGIIMIWSRFGGC